MNATPSMRDSAMAGALGLGLLGDLLVRAEGRPALNVAIWAAAGTFVLWQLARRRGGEVSRETRWLVAGAAGFAGLLVLRDADALGLLCLLSAMVLLGLAAGRGAVAWAQRAHIAELAMVAIRVAVLIVLGPLGWSIGAARELTGGGSHGGRRWTRHARLVARGTVMALPPLIVLTALLMSADPVFERALQATLLGGVEPLLEHVFVAGVIAWFTSGYLRAWLVRDELGIGRSSVPAPALLPSEIAFALSLLNVLFLAFLAVQLRYLFGGAGLVEVTDGLTYAEYARRGFFELTTAATLVVPVLLIADWAAAEEEGRSRSLLRAMSALLVVLLAGVLVSAAYRMRLYQEAYGLTEGRLYGSVFMVWLMGVFVWLMLGVLRGRRRGFAFGAILGGLACVVGLHVLNPHALIAAVNLDRALQGSEYDPHYLGTLSADAVPTLIGLMPVMPEAERCRIAALLAERWSGERPGGWRTWNLSDARARGRVADLLSSRAHGHC